MTNERDLTEASIKAAICGLTEAVQTNQGFEVTLPQIYHSGHNVVVIVRPEMNGFVVHDNSYAAMLLSNLGLSVGKKLSDALKPQISAYGCDLTEMRVWRHCDTFDHLAVAMTLVGCASRLIADHALKADQAPLHDFKSSLLGKIVSVVGNNRVRTNEEFSGHLGGKYRVSAVVLDASESKPVAFVEPVSDREAVARRFKQFYDLSRNAAYDQIDRVVVYDDANPIPSGDALLLEEVSNLVRFVDAPVRFRAWTTLQ